MQTSSDRLYDPTYVGKALDLLVQRFEDGWESFVGAFGREETCIDRELTDLGGGQQVFDTAARINFELRERMAVIYLPEPNVGEVAEDAARSLRSITGANLQMSPQGDQEGMRDVRTGVTSGGNGVYEYVLSVWGAKVPGISKGASDRDGCHVMLSVNILAEAV